MSSEVHVGVKLGATVAAPPADADTRRHAARFVASQARDAQDCALLLDALGLTPEEGQP